MIIANASAQNATECFRYVQRDLCGPMPMACGSQMCDYAVTGWEDDPTDPEKQIPILEWSCSKRGRFNVANSLMGDTCEFTSSTNPSGFQNSSLVPTVGSESNELCWRTRDCLATCVVMQSMIEVPKRWKKPEEHHSNPGTHLVNQRNCMEGVEEWEEPENRPPGYSVEEKYMIWFDCLGGAIPVYGQVC